MDISNTVGLYIIAGGPGSGRHKEGPANESMHKLLLKHGFSRSRNPKDASDQHTGYKHPSGAGAYIHKNGGWMVSNKQGFASGIGHKALKAHLE